MNETGIQSGVERAPSVHAAANSKTQTRSNAQVKEKGLDRATASQSANTKADAKRDFTVAPGMSNAEAASSSDTSARESSSANLQANGPGRARASGSAGASAHTSLAGKIKHHLHL
jgi:hypothetical protein